MMNLLIYTGISFTAAAVCCSTGYNPDAKDPLDDLLTHLIKNRFCSLVMVNLAYNLLLLFGKLLQVIFFGELRTVESKNLYDRLLHFLVFKIIFVGAILEPDFWSLIDLSSLFSVLGFMKIFSLLTRDRFEHIANFNPNAPQSLHNKLIFLLVCILLADVGWFWFCYSVFQKFPSIVLLLSFECLTLFLDTIQTLVKYAIHLLDLSYEGVWEQRGTYVYHTEFFTDTLILAATLGHYIHIFAIHGISLTLIDAVLFLHMRMIFNNLREKIVSYLNYRKMDQNMKEKYVTVSEEELRELDDVCAVCHDKMESAKKLPCRHVFHPSCLRSWLEHHHTCPTCRHPLIDAAANEQEQRPQGGQGPHPPQHEPPMFRDVNREIFHFNGGRWFRWLPNIQVVSERRTSAIPQDMIRRVQEVVPYVPTNIIAEDLNRTRSVELTLENILEGRIEIPEPPQEPVTAPTPPRHPSPIPRPSPQTTRPSMEEFGSSTTSTSRTEPESFNLSDSFASTSEERQQSLQNRKEKLMEQARRQYEQRQQQFEDDHHHSSPPSYSTTTTVPAPTQQQSGTASPEIKEATPQEQRRRVMLEAAQKRLEGKKEV